VLVHLIYVRGTYIHSSKENENLNQEDLYGEETWAHPIDNVIKALKKDMKDDNYWRFKVAYEMLKSIQDNWDWFGEPYVITYGH
jgi:hypothetical protein